MRQLKHGKRPFLAAALLLISGCRTQPAPIIEVCILDGFGGGDCVEPDGTKIYKMPSQMKNYWSTNESDEARYAAFCNDASPEQVRFMMNSIRSHIY